MKELNEAVLLVGGKGTRLQSVVADRPTVLAGVRCKPFLYYLLDQIAAAGIIHTVLCAGYRGEQIQAALGPAGPTAPRRPAPRRHHPRPLATTGALRPAGGFTATAIEMIGARVQ